MDPFGSRTWSAQQRQEPTPVHFQPAKSNILFTTMSASFQQRQLLKVESSNIFGSSLL
uniref:Uncharacterized protein n=1 Tax=Anguilla anguilla TaxID=7936 RepID=A0A0E9XF79_ANGAN